MFLALREMRRAKARFALLVSAVGLLVFLILTQQALQDGLITSFVGAIRQQKADARKAASLDAKVAAQRHIKVLETKRNDMRKRLFEAQDSV